MFDWKSLLSRTPAENLIMLTQKDPKMNYSGVYNLLTASQTRFSSMLGFADATLFTDSGLVDPKAIAEECSLIVGFSSREAYEANTALTKILSGLKNCACITSLTDFQNLYFELENFFSINSFMNTVINTLCGQVAENQPLQEIVNTVSRAFQAPVSIDSNAFSILAASGAHMFRTLPDHPAVQSDIEKKNTPRSVVYALKDSGVLKKIQSSKEPVHYKIMGEYCYAMSLYYQNKRVGYMTVFETNQKIDPEKLAYLSNIRDIVAIAVTKQNEEKKTLSSEFNHLFDLLEDKTKEKDFDMMRLRFSMLNYDLREDMRLLYLIPDHSSTPSFSAARMLISQLSQILRNSCYAIRDRDICFLISRFPDDHLTEDDFKNVCDILYALHYKGGMSSTFRGFEEYLLYYQAAEEAIRIGTKLDPQKVLYFFDDYRISYAAECLSRQKEHSEFFLYPPLMRLIREDRKKGTDLAYTLYCYLSSPKQIDAVCEKLAMHKNTLFFRMKKIRQIMGVDLYDGPEITKVFLTFELLRQNGQLPFDENLL